MSRWLLLSCCVLVLASIGYMRPQREANARPLGAACIGDRQCQLDLRCTFVANVMEGQCAAPCNSTPACQERFGSASLCLGADLCARTCQTDRDCPSAGHCNDFHWCETRQ